MSIVKRVALAVLGLVVALAGMLSWSLENEYGSGLNFSLSGHPGGKWVVSEIDEQKGTSVVAFEGSQEEAAAYTAERRSAGKSFLLPGLIIAAGVLMFAAAIGWPLLRRFHRRDGSVR